MTVKYIQVPISSILKRAERFEANDALTEYDFAGTYSFARGIFVGERKQGASFQLPYIQRIYEGDFVYCKIMAWEGAFGVVPKEAHNCVVSNAFVVYEIDETEVDRRYLSYYFKMPAIWKSIGSHSTGTNVRRRSLHPDQFENTILALPPLEEQRRIVARIEELAAKIEEAQGLRREAVEKREMFNRVILQKLFYDLNEYEETTLETVCASIIDNLHSNPVYADSGIACVRSPDVGWGKLYLTSALRTTEEEYVRRTIRGEPQKEDIIFVREGGGTGKAAIVEEGQRFSLGQRVMMFRLDKNKVIPRFFLYQLLSPLVYEQQVVPQCKGSASPHLNIGALRNFSFILPSLNKQQELVDQINRLQVQIKIIEKQQEEVDIELNALLPSILDKAFKGEL